MFVLSVRKMQKNVSDLRNFSHLCGGISHRRMKDKFEIKEGNILSDLNIQTSLKEEIAKIAFSEMPLKKKRIAMTGGAIDDNPHFALSTIETDRPGNSYTYETLEELKNLPDSIIE